MKPSDALWQLFAATGHVRIYLLYKQQEKYELETELQENTAAAGDRGPQNSVMGEITG
ncbi:hypothetical protein V3F56_00400 [Moorellaceae bacterium AZ2]